jgi:hypothetical protein
MKPVLAFVFHFILATLAVPMLALISAPMVYSVMRRIALSATRPQQFYSDHLFLFVAANGLWLAYFGLRHVYQQVCSMDLDSNPTGTCFANRDLAVNWKRSLSSECCRTLFYCRLPDTELA